MGRRVWRGRRRDDGGARGVEHRVFNVAEVADYLHVSVADVEELVRRDAIPHERLGGRVVFRRPAVDLWASRRILGFPSASLRSYHNRSSARVSEDSGPHALIPELLPVERVEPALASRTKPSLIRDMVERADRTGLLIFPVELREGIEARERMGSTALSGGVAMLHAERHDPYLFDASFLVLARTVQPIPFGSPDGRTTDIFFLLCCREETMHLHALARLCMICHHTDALLRLREADGAAAMHAALVENEAVVLDTLPAPTDGGKGSAS